MWRRDWLLFVADMQEAIQKIGCYVELMSFADFQADSRMVNAVVHNLLVIGEAARCLPTSITEPHSYDPGLPRDRVVQPQHRAGHRFDRCQSG